MRNVGAFFVICIALIATTSHGGEIIQGAFGKSKPAQPTQAPESSEIVLRMMVYVEPEYQPALKDLKEAVHILENLAPEGVRLEGVSQDADVDFVIEVSKPMTPDHDLLPHPALEEVLGRVPSDASSYSIVMDHAPQGPFVVRVFWDRFAKKPDAFVRLISILGREVYGSVLEFKKQRDLLLDPKHRYGDAYREEDRRLFEHAAAQGAIGTLERMLKLASRAKMSKSISRDILEALKREQKNLAALNEAPKPSPITTLRPALAAAQSCEHLFVTPK